MFSEPGYEKRRCNLMAEELRGKRIAALVENGFEQSELLEPKEALEQAGAKVDIVSPQTSHVKSWQHQDWGRTVSVDRQLDQARADEYDALLLPGGVMNPDKLRNNPRAVDFVKRFVESGKPIAAICHGPWTLIEADGVPGTQGHVMAVTAHGPQERRCPLGRSAGRGRQRPRDVAQTRRHPCLQSQDDRGIRRGQAFQAGTARLESVEPDRRGPGTVPGPLLL